MEITRLAMLVKKYHARNEIVEFLKPNRANASWLRADLSSFKRSMLVGFVIKLNIQVPHFPAGNLTQLRLLTKQLKRRPNFEASFWIKSGLNVGTFWYEKYQIQNIDLELRKQLFSTNGHIFLAKELDKTYLFGNNLSVCEKKQSQNRSREPQMLGLISTSFWWDTWISQANQSKRFCCPASWKRCRKLKARA